MCRGGLLKPSFAPANLFSVAECQEWDELAGWLLEAEDSEWSDEPSGCAALPPLATAAAACGPAASGAPLRCCSPTAPSSPLPRAAVSAPSTMFQHDGSLAYCDSQLSSRGPHASTGAASVAAAAAVQPPRPYSVRLPVPFGPAMPQAAPAPLPFAAGSEAEVWLSGWMRLAAEEEGLSPRRLSASPDASRLFAAASPSRGAPAHPGSCSAFPSNGSAGCGSGVHKRGAEVPACELHAASRAWPLAATVSRHRY